MMKTRRQCCARRNPSDGYDHGQVSPGGLAGLNRGLSGLTSFQHSLPLIPSPSPRTTGEKGARIHSYRSNASS